MNNVLDRRYRIIILDHKHGTVKVLFRLLTYEEALEICREWEWSYKTPWDMSIDPEY